MKRNNIIVFFLLSILIVTNVSMLSFQKEQYISDKGIGTFFLYLMVNIHVIAIVILLYLIIKQGIKIFAGGNKQCLQGEFTKNLLFAFTLFSVIPSFFVFFAAGKFIATSIDDWFHIRMNNGLKSSLVLHKVQTLPLRKALEGAGGYLVRRADKEFSVDEYDELQEYYKRDVESYLKENYSFLDNCTLYFWHDDLTFLNKALKEEVDIWSVYRGVDSKTLLQLKTKFLSIIRQLHGQAKIFDFYGSLYWIKKVRNKLCILVHRYPSSIRLPLIEVHSAIDNYKLLQSLRNPIYVNYLYTFFFITLLIIFLSLWAAFYIARKITEPIQVLIQAAKKVKKGMLDTRIAIHSKNDLCILEQGFNEMIEALEQAHHHLAKKNKEMFTTLESLKAAVVFVNKMGRVTSFNKAAKNLIAKNLGIYRFKNKKVGFFGSDVKQKFMKLGRYLYGSKRECVSQELSFHFKSGVRTLMTHMTIISSKKTFNFKEKTGTLIVIEDLTDIVKANTVKTWREAAKHMAHEIKNPLTPIQLATQRLQRRYPTHCENDQIFKNCTNTILKQVAILKNLTTCFFEFASLPAVQFEQVDMSLLVEDIIRFYKISYPDISFAKECSDAMPTIQSDQKKINRILINLLDNSIRALTSKKNHKEHKKVTIAVECCAKKKKFVVITVADNGPGIERSLRDKLFAPYVSNNKKNMGLGLAIVYNEIMQLKGKIVLLNTKYGASFQITLPTNTEKDLMKYSASS